jgi:hypothetical protein
MRRQGKQAAAGDRAPHSPQPAAPVDPSNVEMNLQLNVDCEIPEQEESIRRQKFTNDLKEDLFDASGMEPEHLNILKVSKFIEILSLKEQSDIQGSPLWVTEVYFR